MPEMVTKVGVIPAPPNQERAETSAGSSYYRTINGVTEEVTIVKIPWTNLPIGDVLYHYSRIKKNILDGETGLEETFSELERELVDIRGGFVSSNPRSLLVGRQWTLGMENEQPRGGYTLRTAPGSELPLSRDNGNKGERVITEGERYSLSLDFNANDPINGLYANGNSPQTAHLQHALTLR